MKQFYRSLNLIASIASGYLMLASAVFASEPSAPILILKTPYDNNNATASELVRQTNTQVDYRNFKAIALKTIIDQSQLEKHYLLLGAGEYIVDNPLIIDEKNPILFIHGVDRMRSALLPKNRDQPLFIVRGGQYLNITNVKLDGFDQLNGINLKTDGDSNVVIDLIDCFIQKGALVFNAPGSYRLQGNYLTGLGRVETQIILNNNEADLFIFGGNITDSGLKTGNAFKDYAHIWAKAGRLRVFGTGVQYSRGIADFRIDAPTVVLKPHQIINVRSEGDNGSTGQGSAFIFTGLSDAIVDIDIINSAGLWALSGMHRSALAIYNASGTLQLIGNTASEGAGELVERTSPANYHLTAIANTVSRIQALRDIGSNNLAKIENNLYATSRIADRFVAMPYMKSDRPPSPLQTLGKLSIPIDIPTALTRPRITEAIPGMTSVIDFGAKGDGKTDDTDAIQSAINKSSAVFFPPGHYRISHALAFNTDKKFDHGAGGFIAGAGSNRSFIERDYSGSVFETLGMAYATVQGLALISKRSTNNSRQTAALSLEYKPRIGHATQANTFYDIAIENADIGVAIGNQSPTQCSENAFFNLSIKNSETAVSIGGFNALANIFSNLNVRNSEYGIGHRGDLAGGTWSVVVGNFSNIKNSLFKPISAADSIFFFDHITIDGSPLFTTQNTGALFNQFFNRSNLRNTSFETNSSGGIFFNDSEIENIKGSAHGIISESYIINNSNSKIRDRIEIKKGSSVSGP